MPKGSSSIGAAPSPLTYRRAGVDSHAGHDLVERIKPLAASTRIAEVVGGVGGSADRAFEARVEWPA